MRHLFNGLHDSSEGSGPWFVWIILVVVDPFVVVPRIAGVWNLAIGIRWNSREGRRTYRNNDVVSQAISEPGTKRWA